MILDLVIGLVLALAVWRGWRRGMIEIIASFLLLLVAMFIASMFGTQVGDSLGNSGYLRPIFGFFIVFIVLMIVGSFIIKKIKPKRGVISFFDRIFGAVFSGLRMLLIVGLVCAFFRLFQLPSAATVNSSKIYPTILTITSNIASQLKPLTSKLSEGVFDDTPPPSH